MIIAISLVVCILGLVIYLISTKPKVEWVGQVMFAAGLVAFLFQNSGLLKLFEVKQ